MRLARAPGRVNLIGEHTDYNGLPVLPMALDRGVALRFHPRDDARVIVRNSDPRFAPVAFDLSDTIPAEPGGAWGNYLRAAGQALYRDTGPLPGIEGEVSSTLPMAAGLSSSSALVVATALALLDAAKRSVQPHHLMDVLARGERYVGLEGGGMDQAISLGGLAGHAMRIDFRPALGLTPVPVPPTWRFIVAATGVEAAKSGGTRAAYNARVAECREALARFAGGTLEGPPPADYAALLARMSPERTQELAPQALEGDLLRRFRHVVREGERVEQAEAAMRAGDLAGFGRLMCASHASLRDDYAVSSPALDRLVDAALAGGAAGARLTGAGFGGCIVALASAEGADGVSGALEAVAREVFTAVPGPGAGVDG